MVALGALAGSGSVNSVTGCDFQTRAPLASARQAQDCVLVSPNPALTGAKLQEAFVLTSLGPGYGVALERFSCTSEALGLIPALTALGKKADVSAMAKATTDAYPFLQFFLGHKFL